MSSSSHRVDVDTDILEGFRDELSRAQENVQGAAGAAESEIKSVLDLLQERIDDWEKARRRCLEQLHDAEGTAARRAAQQRLDDVERKLKILRMHVNRVHHDARRLKNCVQAFARVLDEPIGVLSRLVAVLFRYLLMQRSGRDTSVGSSSGIIEQQSEGSNQTKEIAAQERGQRPRNANYAGKTFYFDPETKPELSAKYPEGVKFTQDGYPDFSPYAKCSVKFAVKGNRSTDYTEANKAAGLTETPEDFTWHHHEDCTTMQLVPDDLHFAVQHTGSVSIIKRRNVFRESEV